MSKMAELAYDIETMFIDGDSPQRIGVQLGIPLSLVKSTLKSFGVDVRDLEEDMGDYEGA